MEVWRCTAARLCRSAYCAVASDLRPWIRQGPFPAPGFLWLPGDLRICGRRRAFSTAEQIAEQAVSRQHHEPKNDTGDEERQKQREHRPLRLDGKLAGMELGLEIGVAQDIPHHRHAEDNDRKDARNEICGNAKILSAEGAGHEEDAPRWLP